MPAGENATMVPVSSSISYGQPQTLYTERIALTQRSTVLLTPATENVRVEVGSAPTPSSFSFGQSNSPVKESAMGNENITVPSPRLSGRPQVIMEPSVVNETVLVTDNMLTAMFAGESLAQPPSLMIENRTPLLSEDVRVTEREVTPQPSSSPIVTDNLPGPSRMYCDKPENVEFTDNFPVQDNVILKEEIVVHEKVTEDGKTEYIESVITYNAGPPVIITEAESLSMTENLSLYEPWLGKQNDNLIKVPVHSRDSWGCCGRLW